MDNKVLDLHDKIKLNILKGKDQRNYREIDIKDGLIVLGYFSEHSSFSKKFVVIARYLGGTLCNVNTDNMLVLIHEYTKLLQTNQTELSKHNEERYSDGFDFWRTPTDDEVELYYSLYKDLNIEKEFDKVISDLENDNYTDINDIIEMINDLKSISMSYLKNS